MNPKKEHAVQQLEKYWEACKRHNIYPLSNLNELKRRKRGSD